MRLPLRAFLVGTVFCVLFSYVSTVAVHTTGETLPATQISCLAFLFGLALILLVNPLLHLLKLTLFTRKEVFLIFIMGIVPAGLTNYGFICQVLPMVGGLHVPAWNTAQSKWNDNVSPTLDPNYFLSEPLFQERDIRDWQSFASALVNSGEKPSPQHRIWSLLPDTAKKRLEVAATGKDYTDDEKSQALSKLVTKKADELFLSVTEKEAALSGLSNSAATEKEKRQALQKFKEAKVIREKLLSPIAKKLALSELAREMRLAVVHSILALLKLRDFYQAEEFPGFTPSEVDAELFAKERARLSQGEISRINRTVLESTMPEHIAPNKFIQDQSAIANYVKGLRAKHKEAWPAFVKNPDESFGEFWGRATSYCVNKPAITGDEVEKWWRFYPALLKAGGADASDELKYLWSKLDDTTRASIEKAGKAINESNRLDSEKSTSLSKTVTNLVNSKTLFLHEFWPKTGLPSEARRILRKAVDSLPDKLLENVDITNRKAVESVAINNFSPSQTQKFNRSIFDQAYSSKAFDDWRELATKLSLQIKAKTGPVQQRIISKLPQTVIQTVGTAAQAVRHAESEKAVVLSGLNKLIASSDFYQPEVFAETETETVCSELMKKSLKGLDPIETQKLNRLLIESTLPGNIKRYHAELFGEIPWSSWLSPLAHWLVLALVIFMVFYSLNELVFRQWYEREKLVFPVAKFGEIVLESKAEEGGSFIPSVFRNPIFWVGCIIAFTIIFYNGLVDAKVIQGIAKIDLGGGWAAKRAMDERLRGTVFSALGGGRAIRLHIFFTAIGLAFLLPTEVSFSVWFFYIFMMVQQMIAVWLGYGTNSSSFRQGWYCDASFMTAQGGGAMEVFGLLYLWRVRRQVVAFIYRIAKPEGSKHFSKEEVKEYTVPSLIFFFSSIAILYFLVNGNVPVPMAIFVYAALLFFTVAFVRLVAECGIISFQAFFGPLHIVKIFGLFQIPWAFAAKGLGTVLVLLSGIFLDVKTFIAPTMMNAKYLAVRNRISRWSFVTGIVISIVVTLTVSTVVTLAMIYDGGLSNVNGWFFTSWPKWTFKAMSRMISDPEAMSTVDTGLAAWFAIGAGACAAIIYMRQFFFWMPHPIGLVLFMNPQLGAYWFSFFIAWVCKKAAVRYCDSDGYKRVSGLFIGLIIGELLAVGIASLISILTDTHIEISLNRNQ